MAKWFGSRDEDWVESFVRDGYFHFPHLVEKDAVTTAKSRIDRDLAENYDSTRQTEYESRTFCPGIVASKEILDLLRSSEVMTRISKLVRLSRLGETTSGQIALRRAHQAAAPHPPHPHVDGYPTPQNGVPGNQVIPFTILVGIFLSEVTQEFAGNFTVWPGSHTVVEDYFNRVGQAALTERMPKLEFAQPRQLLASAGDVVLCHYQLAHSAAVNISDFDRYAIFFRVAHKELANRDAKNYQHSVWTHLTKIWTGWQVQPKRLESH